MFDGKAALQFTYKAQNANANANAKQEFPPEQAMVQAVSIREIASQSIPTPPSPPQDPPQLTKIVISSRLTGHAAGMIPPVQSRDLIGGWAISCRHPGLPNRDVRRKLFGSAISQCLLYSLYH